MNEFFADLHIHSRYSRATSKKLEFPLLAAWAQIKGIQVLATGDFTHPAWRKDMKEFLVFDEKSGLYSLKNQVSVTEAIPDLIVPKQPAQVQFMLQGEISSIYKRGGRVRKVHNLVFMPHLEAANAFCTRLEAIGNIASDGRPIIGLDSRDLLEMVLETHPHAFLVPAHIWTPWFSLFGSKSGFDSVEECFGDLSDHIFALETGLSSDPAMNRLISALDSYRLISNSDAHSGEKLARELNVFSGIASYQGILEALKTPETAMGTKFCGTTEFFPEEGKYHADGHRKCNVHLTPAETRELGGICPVCGGGLTVGVHYRVMELADRDEPVYTDGTEFATLVPLQEIVAEIFSQGVNTARVRKKYAEILAKFGTELHVLHAAPEEELSQFFPPLGEAIGRMRRGEVHVTSGYDGEFGVIRMFTDEEQREIKRGVTVAVKQGKKTKVTGLRLLEDTVSNEEVASVSVKEKAATAAENSDCGQAKKKASKDSVDFIFTETTEEPVPASLLTLPLDQSGLTLNSLNFMQQQAALAGPEAVLVLAGPGTGKTRTLIARINHLLSQGTVPRAILAVTFTRKAATEMDKRLRSTVSNTSSLPTTDTLHALALDLWHKTHSDVPVLLSEDSAKLVFAEANPEADKKNLRIAWENIAYARETLIPIAEEYMPMASQYTAHKSAWNLADYTDLLEFWLEQARSGIFKPQWEHVLVDEVQDLSPLQLALVRALVPITGDGFFGIGDPNQSIYGFRGASGRSEEFFVSTWSDLTKIYLQENYRTKKKILTAATALLRKDALEAEAPLRAMTLGDGHIHLFKAPTAEAECKWITDRIAALLGGTSHTLVDAEMHTVDTPLPECGYTPGDIAILLRTHALAAPLRQSLARIGIPVSDPKAEVFWSDPRVHLVLQIACRVLGIALTADEGGETPECPDKVLSRGPLGMAAYLSTVPPFDAVFWHSRPFRELVRAYDQAGGWAELVTWMHLQNDLELVRVKAEKVQILTLHAAKGLEFPVVFLPCLEEGILPFAGPLLSGRLDKQKQTDIEEERRLLYVGMTRAKDALFLSHATKRRFFGADVGLKPSRFITDLPTDLMHVSTLISKKQHQEKQLNLL